MGGEKKKIKFPSRRATKAPITLLPALYRSKKYIYKTCFYSLDVYKVHHPSLEQHSRRASEKRGSQTRSRAAQQQLVHQV